MMIPEPYVPPPIPNPGNCSEPPPELWLNFLDKWEEMAALVPPVPDPEDPDRNEIEEEIHTQKDKLAKLLQRFVSRGSYGKVVMWIRAMGGLQYALWAARPKLSHDEVALYADTFVSPFSILAPDLADLYSYKFAHSLANDDTL